jgi:hypothetical protein
MLDRRKNSKSLHVGKYRGDYSGPDRRKGPRRKKSLDLKWIFNAIHHTLKRVLRLP